MSTPIVYQWKVPQGNLICDQATADASGNLPLFNNARSISLQGVSRPLAISSTSDLSSVSFAISGLYNGFSVLERINGANNGTVFTQNVFSSVNGIVVTGTMAGAVDIGTGIAPTGIQGVSDWFSVDYYRNVLNLGVYAVLVAGNVNYTLETTLDSVQSVQESDLTLFNPVSNIISSTTSQNAVLTDPIMYVRLKFNQGTNVTGQLKAYFMQQGSN